MINQPLVSVIIPCYNCEKTIKNTISSVLNQTYTDYEIIIIDDLSRDDTEKICREITKLYSNVEYFKLDKNSGGPSYPSNFGVSKANGEYIAFLDHDDVWLPTKLEKQINLIKRDRLDMVSCNTISVIDQDESVINMDFNPPYLDNILKRNYIATTSSIVIRRDVFNKLGGFDVNLKGPQDWDFYINFFSKNFKFNYLQEALVKHINLDTNLSSSVTSEKFESDRSYIYNKYKYLYTNRISADYFKSLGVHFLLLEDYKKSFDMLIESIKLNPFKIKPYLFLILIKHKKTFERFLNLKIKYVSKK